MIWLLAVALFGGILLLAVVSQGSGSKSARRGFVDKAMVAERWQAIQTMANTGGAGMKQAISEADKLLDYVLKQSGARGQTMADRLRNYEKKFTNINAIWHAHKLRNTLAHEINFDLVTGHAQEALHDFERGLKDLGAL